MHARRDGERIKHRTALGTAAAGAAMFSWGFGPILVKLVELDGLSLSFYRLWLGLGVMLVALALLRRRLRLEAVRRSLVGGVMFGVQVAFFFSALKLTSVADVMLISALQPVLVMFVAGPWFGETVDRRKVRWTVVSLAGVTLVVLGSAGTPVWSLAGDLFAVAALITWTAYWLASKQARTKGVGAVEYMSVVTFVSALIITPVALVSGQDLVEVQASDWVWLSILVIFPGAGGHVLMAWAHRYVDVTISSLLIVGVPVVSVLAAWSILDEPLGPLQILGSVIVLAAIAAIVREPKPAPPEVLEAAGPGAGP